jgi:hypothetical protein
MQEPKAYYREIYAGRLDNGMKYLLIKTGRMQYGLKLEDTSGNALLYGFKSSEANLEENLKSYLSDYC